MRCPKCNKFIEYVNSKFLSKSQKTLIRVWYCSICDMYWKEHKRLMSITRYKRMKKEEQK